MGWRKLSSNKWFEQHNEVSIVISFDTLCGSCATKASSHQRRVGPTNGANKKCNCRGRANVPHKSATNVTRRGHKCGTPWTQMRHEVDTNNVAQRFTIHQHPKKNREERTATLRGEKRKKRTFAILNCSLKHYISFIVVYWYKIDHLTALSTTTRKVIMV